MQIPSSHRLVVRDPIREGGGGEQRSRSGLSLPPTAERQEFSLRRENVVWNLVSVHG